MTDPTVLRDLEERVAALESLTVELDAALPQVLDVQPVAGAGARTRFSDPVEWVDRVLAALWAGRRAWCPRWWEHGEVYERIVWLWRSWETAIAVQDRDGASMASWLLAADHHREVLQAESGPFSNCRSGHSQTAALLPATDRTPGTDDGATPWQAEQRFFAAQHPPSPEGQP